ncbi:TetR family transcriptional regulator [Brevibacterium sp. 5221]|uniref:TetR family transcriptional regulator n=1 Tax=Brevibacterium rongguiense TaxID=2695267 RepID=A0A6N9H5D6_9MICO|nr:MULTISPECIES: TetR family transcriptional regulator [Brevibacterium]MYM19006.1 TetR family transcriptional regulator [Brevibacterium rongguiense]WAL40704.1 TetR family transcriptional regulator [Brevibacterium sp. BRM-1]
MPLTTDSIADAALAILADFGMGDLSMRRLARDLDVQPSALYWHVKNKQEVFVLVSRRLSAEVDARLPRGTAASAVVVATALRDVLLRHRDGAEIFLLAYSLDAESTVPERLEEAVPDPAAQEALLSFVLGHVQIEQNRQLLGVADAGAGERFAAALSSVARALLP